MSFRSSIDENVSLADFDEWAISVYRSSGRNHQGLVCPVVYTQSRGNEAFRDIDDLTLPGNIPADVYCPYWAWEYFGSVSGISLASLLMERPLDAVDLQALRIAATHAKSAKFAKHVANLIEALRTNFPAVCSEIRGDGDLGGLLEELDQQALELAEDSTLAESLTNWAWSSGCLAIVGDEDWKLQYAQMSNALRQQVEPETQFYDHDESRNSSLVSSIIGDTVRATLGDDCSLGWRKKVQAAHYVSTPAPLLLTAYQEAALSRETAMVLILPAGMEGSESEVWIYEDGSEYSTPVAKCGITREQFFKLNSMT